MAQTVLGTPSSQPLRTGSLERMPGLDGVRAIAVMAVLVFHANPSRLPGGFLGVDVFFTLSGFLITSLLLAELDAAGGLDFGRFYQRRAKRLLPAMFLVLIATSVLAMTVAQDAAARLREDILSSTFYVTNWWYVVHGTSYFEATGRPPLLQHLWSLAVEEQFYLAWPLLLYTLWRLGRVRGVRIGAVAGALGSTALMTWIAVANGMPGAADSGRVYFGTDTHAMTLLVGAALATFWRQGSVVSALTPRSRDVVNHIGFGSLALLLAVFWFVEPLSPALYRGGFLVVGLLTAVVVASAAVTGTAFSRGLAREPLRWLGQRSYGIYLWHWPIFMVLRPGIDLDVQGWPVQVARFALAFLTAELSYRFVEMPVRRGAVGRLWAGWKQSSGPELVARTHLAVVTVIGVVLALGVGLSSAQRPTVEDALGGVTSVGDSPLTPTPATPAPTAATLEISASSPVRSSAPLWTDGSAYVGPSTPPKTRAEVVAEARAAHDAANARRMGKLSTTAVGDSVMLASYEGLTGRIPKITVDARVSRQASEIFDRIRERKKFGQLGDIVVIGAGTNGPIDSPDLVAILNLLKDRKRVILVTCYADRSWIAQSNAAIWSAAKAFRKGNVRVANWQNYAAHHTWMLYDDGIHPMPEGGAAYARLIQTELNR
jgi:peptidoglycan/LPS O-acetylase OafA/YrhL